MMVSQLRLKHWGMCELWMSWMSWMYFMSWMSWTLECVASFFYWMWVSSQDVNIACCVLVELECQCGLMVSRIAVQTGIETVCTGQ